MKKTKLIVKILTILGLVITVLFATLIIASNSVIRKQSLQETRANITVVAESYASRTMSKYGKESIYLLYQACLPYQFHNECFS